MICHDMPAAMFAAMALIPHGLPRLMLIGFIFHADCFILCFSPYALMMLIFSLIFYIVIDAAFLRDFIFSRQAILFAAAADAIDADYCHDAALVIFSRRHYFIAVVISLRATYAAFLFAAADTPLFSFRLIFFSLVIFSIFSRCCFSLPPFAIRLPLRYVLFFFATL